MYHTIMIPLDGSKRAERILPLVEVIAQKFGAQLVLLQVVEPTPPELAPARIVSCYRKTVVDQWIEEARQYLAGLKGELTAKGLQVKTVIETGAVLPALYTVAAREHADLIALASHGRTGLAHAFYGSVATALLNQTNWPLLLVRALD